MAQQKQSEKKSLLGEIAMGALGLAVLLPLFYYLAEVPVLRLPLLCLWLLLYLSGCILLVNYAINPHEMVSDMAADFAKGEAGDTYLFGYPALFISCFFLICVYADRAYPGWLFEGGDGGLLSWIMYLVDNLARVFALDFFETFRIELSDVRHTDSLLAKSFVFSFKAVLSIALINPVANALEYHSGRH